MKSYSHWGMFHCWEAPGLPPMAEQPERSATYGRDTQQRCACRGGFNQGVGHYDPYCPHYVEQPKSWVHVPIGAPCLPPLPDGQSYTPYPVTNYTLAEALTPHEDDLKLTIVKT